MQRTPTHAMPALHANNGAFPFRRAFIHASRGSTCRPRSTPTNSRMVATHQEQPMLLRQIAGAHDHPSTAPSREMLFHSRPAFIHAWRGSTCRPRSTPTNSRMVATHQEPRADQRSPPTNSSGNLSKAGWVRLRGREPHGPEACLGRVGQDAQPRSCRVRRTAHTSKRRPSLHGRTCSVPRNRTHPAIPRNARFCRCRCRCR